MTTPLQRLLDEFRRTASSRAEQGRLFENLCICYLRHEPIYEARFGRVWAYGDWGADDCIYLLNAFHSI